MNTPGLVTARGLQPYNFQQVPAEAAIEVLGAALMSQDLFANSNLVTSFQEPDG